MAHEVLTGAQAIIRSLELLGVDTIFGLPGGAILPTYDPLMDSKKIRHILVRHEQGAGHAAEGYASASGKLGVCIATSGPGATNLVTAGAYAYLGGMPERVVLGRPVFFVDNDPVRDRMVVFGGTGDSSSHAWTLSLSGTGAIANRNVGTGKLIVKVVRAKTFGGYIGMTVTHPVVIAELKIAEQKKSTTATDTTGTTVTNTIGKKKQTDVPLWLEELLSNNTNTTPGELLALVKQKVDGTPPFPTEATTSETETCLSPITDTSGNDNVSTDKFISGNC